MKRTKTTLYTVSILVILLIVWASTVLASDDNRPINLNAVISNELDMSFTVSQSTPTPIATPRPQSTAGSSDGSEQLTIIVDNGDGTTIAAATIRRTKDASGRITDQVTFGDQQAAESVAGAKAAGRTTARIVIPDSEDKVSELLLQIPRTALDLLSKGGMDLEIFSDNASITIPNASLTNVTEDLFFRLVPIKDSSQRAEVEERARAERVVREAVSDENIQVVARPMTIETNLTSRAVKLVLPLLGVELPADEKARDAYLAELAIFIEHSDGDRELVKPEAVEFKKGLPGLAFGINKFSTFTILKLEGPLVVSQHDAYMLGYPDGTFRPDQGMTRDELAAVLYRLKAQGETQTGTSEAALSDLTHQYWSDEAVKYAASTGLMKGYPGGTFKPKAYVTRAEFSAIVSRWQGLSGGTESFFSDTANHWAQSAIGALLQEKLVSGYPDGTFRPDRPLTRAEAVTTINVILHRSGESWIQPSWSDVPATHWAFHAIEEASETHDYTSRLEAASADQR
ncbi:S-layer homology domain-containing protein [Paenibacillus sinopodophylli]|uniref:S-layer homology domain-containing protein n=1 Tax=Paenibacillus sinopodophylli TaxID=1837342 RepID=UPI00110D1787|nr:S-layer homology domain-containing protein [Paenibacillus sinopodophylli]